MPARTTSSHMTWTVDHEARVIRVEVRLAVYRKDGPTPTPTEAEWIANTTSSRWMGLHFACYRVDVVVHVRPVDDRAGANDDEVPVQVDFEGNCWVDPEVPPGPDPLGDKPGDRVRPREAFFNWEQPFAWPHELGHILGLHDGYASSTGRPRVPGHPDDMMFDEGNETVSSETVARLVRRSGEVDESSLRCSLAFDATPGTLNLFLAELRDLSVRAWACEWRPPSTDPAQPSPPISFEGFLSFDVGYLHGEQNAGPRVLVEALGVDTGPLVDMHEGSIPVTFTVSQGGPQTLSIVAAPGLVLEAEYAWDPFEGVPVVQGPLRVNGVSTLNFWPGPPVRGTFSKNAPECSS